MKVVQREDGFVELDLGGFLQAPLVDRFPLLARMESVKPNYGSVGLGVPFPDIGGQVGMAHDIFSNHVDTYKAEE